MRNFIIAGLMATSLVPVAGQAQVVDRGERAELRRDRQEVREERRDLDRALRNGTREDVRDARQDYRGARQELREDRRDARSDYRGRNYGRNDWRGYRDRNRELYRGGRWQSSNRYQTFRPGLRIGSGYYQPRYYVNDYGRYHLPRPGYNQRWVRHYNDVLLIDTRRGYVVDVIRNFYWNR